ncbi:SWIM zinc finger domain-containing protein [Haloferula chungangensis]|uniref:SWIM zinc finger domain-containing protein n=1 Tax=Haloferula chungangensis TaxID=1048331 RepID=A0ABW2L762_9BACT
MLTADQVTAIVPDAASLKAGRGLATARKWQSLGGDDEALWGLAVGSGKNPYQTRVSLSDLATKCSCPSRKFPCKHAIALMLIATGEPGSLSEKTRPDWVTEWFESRAERLEKSAAKKAGKADKPVDEKAAAKRREKKAGRIEEGVDLLRQTLLDLCREGLASPAARDVSTWENLQRRMIDCQAPGLAGAVRYVGDEVLRHAQVESQLAFEMGRLFLLCRSYERRDQLDESTRAQVEELVGDGRKSEDVKSRPAVEDQWFVAGRRMTERDRLMTSMTWLLGRKSARWAKVLRFAHLPSSLAEPWPLGSTVNTGLCFYPGPGPSRALPMDDGQVKLDGVPTASDECFEALLSRYAKALTDNPFLRSLPFLMELRPELKGRLADTHGKALQWGSDPNERLRVEAVTGGAATLACGEWDGSEIHLLALADGSNWVPLQSRLP